MQIGVIDSVLRSLGRCTSDNDVLTTTTTCPIEELEDTLKAVSKQHIFNSELFPTWNEFVETSCDMRVPEQIKRDIKHEKNPMKLKQLNQELNASYKYWKPRRKGSN